MSQSLNQLFDALVQSEQAAEAEKNKYQEAKRNIQLHTERLDSEIAKEAEVATEIQTWENNLDGVDTVIEEVTHHERFLEERAGQIRSENTDKINKIANLRNTWKSEAMQLMKQAQEFSAQYGLSSNTREKRLEGARSNLKKVTVELEALQQEIEEKKSRLADINELLTRREKMGVANQKFTSVENDLQVSIREEDSKIHELQKENLTLKIAPESGEEFSQVNEDIDKYRTDQLETRAEDLHNQLSAVTDELRRQEGQTLRQQFRKWQRLRQQQHISVHIDSQQHHQQQQQQQQQQKAEPATECESDGQTFTFPPQVVFQTLQDMTTIEISPDVSETVTSCNTDRPGFGMSAQREVLPGHGRAAGGSTTPSPVGNKTQAGNPSLQQEIHNCPDYIYKDSVGDASQGHIKDRAAKTNTVVFTTSNPHDAQSDSEKQQQLYAGVKNNQKATTNVQSSVDQDLEAPELKLIFSQDDILCPSASTVSETTARSNKESLEGTSQNTIFISSPS